MSKPILVNFLLKNNAQICNELIDCSVFPPSSGRVNSIQPVEFWIVLILPQMNIRENLVHIWFRWSHLIDTVRFHSPPRNIIVSIPHAILRLTMERLCIGSGDMSLFGWLEPVSGIKQFVRSDWCVIVGENVVLGFAWAANSSSGTLSAKLS